VRIPRQERAKATVEAILGGTVRVLRERGYHETTTNHIAAAAGVSVGSFYQYFADKDAAITAVVERLVEDARALVRDATTVAVAGPPDGSVREWTGTLMEFACARGELIQVVFQDVPYVWRIPAVRHAMADAQQAMHEQIVGQDTVPPRLMTDERLFVIMTAFITVISQVAGSPRRRAQRQAIAESLAAMVEAYLASLVLADLAEPPDP
jgi:AcrR family transcriptional regulator